MKNNLVIVGPKQLLFICNCFVIVIMQEKLESDVKIEVAFFVIICRRIWPCSEWQKQKLAI